MKSCKGDEEILRLLARGDQEIEAGEGFALKDVLAETRAFLTEPLDSGPELDKKAKSE